LIKKINKTKQKTFITISNKYIKRSPPCNAITSGGKSISLFLFFKLSLETLSFSLFVKAGFLSTILVIAHGGTLLSLRLFFGFTIRDPEFCEWEGESCDEEDGLYDDLLLWSFFGFTTLGREFCEWEGESCEEEDGLYDEWGE
jgi:hypothetical protein